MTELPGVLAAFLDATGCMVSVWAKDEEGGAPVRLAAAPRDGPCHGAPPLRKGEPYRVDSPDGNILVAPIPGPRRVWIAVGPCADATDPLDRYLKFLLPVVSQYLQSTLEVSTPPTSSPSGTRRSISCTRSRRFSGARCRSRRPPR